MNIFVRLRNAYESGGIFEVARKTYYHVLYMYNGKKIVSKVLKAKCEYGIKKDTTGGQKIIVSMTTYPKRFSDLELCLKSLVLQTVKPDKIIVYLGADSTGVELPSNIKRFEEYGVEFRVDEKINLRSYKKFFYAMQDFPEDVVITADDDIIYPHDWVESLVSSYKKYPNAISARRVHMMRLQGEQIAPYNSWRDQYRRERKPCNALFPTGCSGVLYPPHSLDERAFDKDIFMDICTNADDVWLKCMALLNGYPTVWVPNNVIDLPEVENSYATALQNNNVGENMNDIYLEKVMKKFQIEPQQFFENVK